MKLFTTKIEKVVLVILALAGAIIFFHENLISLALGFDFVLLGVSVLVLMIAIGSAGMKALVQISAGLSLIIFLGQSYCAIPVRAASGDVALKFLIMIGVVYLIYDFFKIFWEGVTPHFKGITGSASSKIWKFLLAVFFLAVVVLFLWTVYEVVHPVLFNLCVYK